MNGFAGTIPIEIKGMQKLEEVRKIIYWEFQSSTSLNHDSSRSISGVGDTLNTRC
jgi:hypothetical protein